MKRLINELSDKQHLRITEHLQKGTTQNLEKETFSGYGFNQKMCKKRNFALTRKRDE